MAIVYVVSEEEGAGKTALTAALAHVLREQGQKATALKPIASGSADPDPETYRELLGQADGADPLDLPDAGLTPQMTEEVSSRVAAVSGEADVVLVEGSCGLSAGDSAQLAESLNAKVLVVSRYDHELEAAQLTHWREEFGERLAGFVINGLTLHMGTDVRTSLLPSMEREGLVSFGVIPEDRRLLGATVSQVAEHLEGRFSVCEEKADRLVEHFMVGGMGMDPGELYFGSRDDKAVIVRGDRPDLQMSALGTPTACMVLTKGIDAIEYVKYEAEQEEVSIVVVPTDTLGTMDSLATLMSGSRFDHPAKLNRFAELATEHLDLPALLGALGVRG
jgi:BioD-like phosphotransacetylase family protein